MASGRVRFRLVPERSKVAIHATSNVHPIDGEASGLGGFVELTLTEGRPDLSEAPEAEVTLSVTDLSSGNTAYDTEMRRRLEARKYPTISGRLTDVKEASEAGVYKVEGDLTFHGVTRSVSAEISVQIEEEGLLHARWEQVIDIRNFDLTPPRILMFKVDPEVRVEVSLWAEREEKT